MSFQRYIEQLNCMSIQSCVSNYNNCVRHLTDCGFTSSNTCVHNYNSCSSTTSELVLLPSVSLAIIGGIITSRDFVINAADLVHQQYVVPHSTAHLDTQFVNSLLRVTGDATLPNTQLSTEWRWSLCDSGQDQLRQLEVKGSITRAPGMQSWFSDHRAFHIPKSSWRIRGLQ